MTLRERSPSLLASVALHLAVVLATLVTWPWARELKVGSVTPVNIVSSAPSTDVRQALRDEQELEALTEQPVPDAPVETVAPPQPEPAPTPPAPTPPLKAAPAPKTPAPKATQPAPKTPPAKPKPKTERSSSDFLDSLAADVAKLSKNSGAQKSSASKGASRPETAREARPQLGQGLSGAALEGLADELQRRWNPNCEVEGGRDVRIRVTFTLGPGGRVVGEVQAGGQERSSNAVIRAAAERAIRAVYAAQPFSRLPREFQGSPIAVNFNAREACS